MRVEGACRGLLFQQKSLLVFIKRFIESHELVVICEAQKSSSSVVLDFIVASLINMVSLAVYAWMVVKRRTLLKGGDKPGRGFAVLNCRVQSASDLAVAP